MGDEPVHIESQYAATARRDDRRIGYRLIGRGDRKLVLIAGTAMSSGFWDIAQVPTFARTAECLLVDNPGTRETDPLPAGEWATSAMADDIVAAMDAVGWADGHLIGHSMGAVVVAEFGHLHADRAQSLSMHAVWKSSADVAYVKAWFEARRATVVGGDRESWSLYAFLLVSPHYLQKHGRNGGAVAMLAERVGETPRESLLGHYDADLAYNGTSYLKTLKSPTLVTAAEEDRVIPPFASEEVARLVPGAKFHLLRGCGHLAPLEDAEQFNKTQLDFVFNLDRKATRDS